MLGDGASAAGASVAPMFTHTVGVDLSVTRRRTAVVSIEWGERSATVCEPVVGPSDDELVGLVAGAEWVGISAPFGWPSEAVSALHSYGIRGDWPDVDKATFQYRCTDLFVHDFLLDEVDRKVWPLSVSSDGIALTAARLARLREEVGRRSGVKFDRSGADGVVEVFPGAALLLWGFERGAYRRGVHGGEAGGVARAREEFVASVEALVPWLKWGGSARSVCVENEDAVDGVVCALVARAAALGLTKGVGEGLVDVAKREGWVHLPEKGGLGNLVGGGVEVVGKV